MSRVSHDRDAWRAAELLDRGHGKGELAATPLESKIAWVNDELRRFAGNLVSCHVQINGDDVRVVSVHSPAWPISADDRFAGIDTSAVRLKLARDVWLADVLWATVPTAAADGWIVGGAVRLTVDSAR